MTLLMTACVAASGFARAETSSPCAATPETWPTFCGIPEIPKGGKTPADFHTAVVDTRLAGRDLTRDTDSSHFTLDGTAAFSARAIAEAAPPPPVTTPWTGDTDQFAKAARAAAKAPKHSR